MDTVWAAVNVPPAGVKTGAPTVGGPPIVYVPLTILLSLKPVSKAMAFSDVVVVIASRR